MRKLLACTRSTRHVGDFVFGGFFLFLHSAILLAHPGSRCPFAFFPFLGNGWIRRRTCYPREFWAVSEIVQLNGKRPGRWRRDVSDQMDERLHRLPIARGRQAVLDGTLPREKGRGMPIAKKDEAGADLGATATAAFPPFHQIFVFLLSKILLPD